MASKTTSTKFNKWVLTPSEMLVLGAACFIIWVAKEQDSSGNMTAAPSKRENHATLYIPSLGYREPAQPVPKAEVLPADTTVLMPKPVPKPLRESVSPDQQRFFSMILRQRSLLDTHKLTEKEENALLKNAAISYVSIETIFREMDESIEGQRTPAEILRKPANAEQIFTFIEKRFGIPVKVSRIFAKNPKATIADWALFIEQQQR